MCLSSRSTAISWHLLRGDINGVDEGLVYLTLGSPKQTEIRIQVQIADLGDDGRNTGRKLKN